MSLTVGSGPFGKKPQGSFNFDVAPATGSVLFFDPVPRSFTAGRRTAPDAVRAYDEWFAEDPPGDVRLALLEPSEKRTRCASKGSAASWHVRVELVHS